MKNILVPTDFSFNARIAARQAAIIARFSGARLLLFHALYPIFTTEAAPPAVEEITFAEAAIDPEIVAQTKLDRLAKELHAEFGVSVSRLMKPGFALEEIPVLAQMLQADLLIMGAQGTNAHKDKAFGQVAVSHLLASDVPVICISEHTDLSNPSGLHSFLQEAHKCCNTGGLMILRNLLATLPALTPEIEVTKKSAETH